MKFLVTTPLLVCFCIIYTLADGNDSHSLQPRIVNGTIAKLGEYPYIARIIWYWRAPKLTSITCSATAISKDYVLTAARCYQHVIDDKKKRDDATLTVNLTETYGMTEVAMRGNAPLGGMAQRRTGVQLIVHTAYLHISTMFDINIALVKVNSPWIFVVPTVHLPIFAKPISPDRYLQCTGVGVGRTDSENVNKSVSSFTVNVGGVNYCKYLQKEYSQREVLFDTFYMCAKAVDPGQDNCKGDLGGALICDGLLAGIMSQRVADRICQVGGAQFTMYVAVGATQVHNWLKVYIPTLLDAAEIPVVDPWDSTNKRP